MTAFRSAVGMAVGIVLFVTGPAAAENVLRFTSLTGGAVTMDSHSLILNTNLCGDRAGVRGAFLISIPIWRSSRSSPWHGSP
jgi:hypothetical protein